ncbi:TPA: fumarate hydratase [Candidatus Bathyarchaeota archaeon]|nr:fumarate hydratase [Candidatus Bathyarchaeota archaeon]
MRKIELHTPLSEKKIRRLNVGDHLFISGRLITARDAAHKRMMKYTAEKRKLPFSFEGSALYHCGPLVRKVEDEWIVFAAGPTTSMRMEPFEAEVIENLGVRLVIGKGGMGEKTMDAMKRFGAVYGVFTGGAAVLAAKHIKRVVRVEWLDLGMPEAAWVFEVNRFGPLIVGMDSHGRSLYEEVRIETRRRLNGILEALTSE